MDNRKFQSASSASPPAVEASPSTGYPTDGNPSTATPATIPGARWFHQIGEELRNVIASAGLTPSDSDLTQLQQAIAAMTASGGTNDFKASVRIATTANIASLTGLAAIDGVTPIAGDRILVKDQSTGSQNGIYVAAAGAWSRATDADTGAELKAGALVTVTEGTINADTVWELSNNGTVTIGSTALVFQWAAGLNGVTAAQFDNSRKLATTAFVQRSLGNLQGALGISANTTLTAADVGKLIYAQTNTSFAITLPLISAVAAGSRIEVFSSVASITVQRQGTDVINVNAGNVNSLVLNAGDTLVLESNGSSWTAVGGAAQLGSSAAFGSSLAASGYQKLPSGLIIQWGSGVTAVGGGAIAFPIAFPTICRGVQVTNQVAGAPPNYLGRGSPTTSGFSCWNNTNTAGTGFDWFAIGY